MYRVITPFGFGRAGEINQQGKVSVQLDEPFLGKNPLMLDSIGQVFLFSDSAIIRVLNISGAGLFSNLQFHLSPPDWQWAFQNSSPPDETKFLLDLDHGVFTANRQLGFLAQDYLALYPWVDRWGPERTVTYEHMAEAVNGFADQRENLCGATGIHASLLLDIQLKRILWFYLTINPPQGVIYEEKFIE